MQSKQALPPQAYTKETLVKAFQWLEEQSAEAKKLVQTPDDLVRAYLGSQNIVFDNEDNSQGNEPSDFTHVKLKTTEITSSSKELELSRSPASQENQASSSSQIPHKTKSVISEGAAYVQENKAYKAKYDDFSNKTKFDIGSKSNIEYIPNSSDNDKPHHQFEELSAKSNARPKSLLNYELDQISLNTIEKVKLLFNLSSDREALRAALAMANRSLNQISKKNHHE